MAWLGLARHGKAGQGKGTNGPFFETAREHGAARRGEAWLGMAGSGKAGHGKARGPMVHFFRPE